MESPKLFLKRYLISMMSVIIFVAISLAVGSSTLGGAITVILLQLISLFIMLYGIVSANTDFVKYTYDKTRKGYNYFYAFNAFFTIAVFVLFMLFYMQTFISAFVTLL